MPLSRQGAQCGFGQGSIFRELFCSARSQADRALQPISSSVYAIFRCAELVIQLCSKSRHRKRQFITAARGFAEPEWNAGGLSFRIFDIDLTQFDSDDAVCRVTQLEDITGEALECKILIQRPNGELLGQQYNVIIELVGYCAAVRYGSETRTAPAAHAAVNRVQMQVSPTPTPSGGIPVGQHLDNFVKPLAGCFPVGPGTAQYGIQLIDMPFLGCDLGDNLLGENIPGGSNRLNSIEFLALHSIQQGGTFH